MQRNPHLPDDLLVQIFSILPTKSVGKCRCLSKSWRSRLSTPQFAKLHLTRKTHTEQNIILVANRTLTIHTITAPFIRNAAVRDLQLPNGNVIGSHSGLVLLVSGNEIILVNPVTLQKVIIPHPNIDFDKDRMRRMHGFGYDSRSDDYKIVMLTCIKNADMYVFTSTTTVDVYSVKLGVWRRLDNSPYDHGQLLAGAGTTSNGAVHWLAYDTLSRCLVNAAFDLADEVFREVPIPAVGFHKWDLEKTLFYDLGGCFCMVSSLNTSIADVWIMREYGVVESWSKFSIKTYGQYTAFRPLCFLGDGKILALTHYMVVVYGVEDGEMGNVVSDGMREYDSGYICGLTFTDSLISPADIPWVMQA